MQDYKPLILYTFEDHRLELLCVAPNAQRKCAASKPQHHSTRSSPAHTQRAPPLRYASSHAKHTPTTPAHRANRALRTPTPRTMRITPRAQRNSSSRTQL